MAFSLTVDALRYSQSGQISPQIVLEIDGAGTFFSAGEVRYTPRYGDDNLVYGQDGLLYGFPLVLETATDLISFDKGTFSEIRQTLNIDKGTDNSTGKLTINLIDKEFFATELISPGFTVPDILGRRAKVWLGFKDLRFKEDYITIFRGLIDEVQAKAGNVSISISSSDTKKRAAIFLRGETELTAAVNNNPATVTLPVDDTSTFLAPYTGPNGLIDDSLKLYVRVNDEIIRYEGLTGSSFTSCTRAQLGSTIANHNEGDTVESIYVLEGNVIDLVLKMMVSGVDGFYLSNITPLSFVDHTIANILQTFPNTIAIDSSVINEANIQIGDFVTVTNSSSNDFSLKEILLIRTIDNITLLEIDETLTAESGGSAEVSFRSQYDTWGPGAGFAMLNDEIDIAEHLFVKRRYLTSASMRFELTEEIKSGLEFISEQLLNPVSAFSIPRKAQSSIGYHIGPIPGANIKELNSNNCLNASELVLTRSINQNFYNSIIYKYDFSILDDRFLSGNVSLDGASISRIPVGNRPLIIESLGLRSSLSASTITGVAAPRRLSKYKYGAETIKGVKTNFAFGFDLEVGDKILVNLSELKISDIKTATRSGDARIFEISNKTFNIKTGVCTFDIVDTNFDLSSRFALIGPSSIVKAGIDESSFEIQASFNTDQFGTDEFKKWQSLIGATIRVRSTDFVFVGEAILQSISGNILTVDNPFTFTPQPGYIVELSLYDNQANFKNATVIYGYMSDGVNDFDDNLGPYRMS
jgi:hypothetical protein